MLKIERLNLFAPDIIYITQLLDYYKKNPDFILPLIGFVAVGGFLGSYYGSKKYDAKKIQKIMGGIIIVAIILLTRKML